MHTVAMVMYVNLHQLNAFTGENFVANKTTVVGLGEPSGGGAGN